MYIANNIWQREQEQLLLNKSESQEESKVHVADLRNIWKNIDSESFALITHYYTDSKIMD